MSKEIITIFDDLNEDLEEQRPEFLKDFERNWLLTFKEYKSLKVKMTEIQEKISGMSASIENASLILALKEQERILKTKIEMLKKRLKGENYEKY